MTRKHGALLIFDEVMTGFRVAYGGAQSLFGIKPDLTTLGKIIGGGLPVGAYGGRAEIMDHMSAGRQGLSGGHAQRQSAGHGRRHRHAYGAPRYEPIRPAGRPFRSSGTGLEAAAKRAGVPAHRCAGAAR